MLRKRSEMAKTATKFKKMLAGTTPNSVLDQSGVSIFPGNVRVQSEHTSHRGQVYTYITTAILC